MRVYVAHRGHSVELGQGVTVIGRHVGCQLRFNDPQISRIHLRVFVDETGVEVEDAGSRNGTRVNGSPLLARMQIHSGDRIELGNREVMVKFEDHSGGGFDEETDVPAFPPPLAASHQQLAGSVAVGTRHSCPTCGGTVSVEQDACPHCGYSWGEFRPGLATASHDRITQEFSTGMRRRNPRFRVDLPIIYRSESLEIEAVALDLSRGGLFVQTQVLEPVDTECAITILVDGAPPLALKGRIVRTVEGLGTGSPPGLGIEFTEVTPANAMWLDDLIANAGVSDS